VRTLLFTRSRTPSAPNDLPSKPGSAPTDHTAASSFASANPRMAFCLNPAKTVSFPHNPTSPDLLGSVWITSPQLPAQATMARNVFECLVTSARGSRPPSKDSPSAAEPLGSAEPDRSIALPADQVLESAMDYPGVEDLVNLIVILVLDFNGGRSAGVLAGEGDWSVLFKESNVEHRVEVLQAQRQVELVSMGGDLLEDLEWAEAFVVKFDGRPPGLEILPVEPDKGAGGPVGGWLATGIGVLGVGLVGSVNLVPEELVEGSEVLGDLVGNVERDVFEGQ
ncbi:hypothetical protein C0989_009218, partial [Termitomyces sp. Mn162]